MKASDYIVNFLIEKGVTDVFGYPGGMVTHLMDSFCSFKDKISAHVTYHEQAAAFAACGYAQSSNKIGVAYATSGPGATNLITGICNAYFDSIPVIFITGQVNSNEQKGNLGVRQRGFQETDIVSIVKTVTKYAVCIKDAESIPEELDKAYNIAMSGRKGPVLLDVPMNFFRAEILDGHPSFNLKFNNSNFDVFPEEFIKKSLSESSAPVFLIGAGVKSSNNVERIRSIVNKFKIPTVSSMIAFDVLSDNPFYYGFVGAYGTRAANFIVAKSDLIITIGSRLDIRQVGIHRNNFAPEAKIIRFDIDRGELQYKVHEDEHQFCIDIDTVLNYFDKLDNLENFASWISVCNEIKHLLTDIDSNSTQNLMNKLNRLITDDSLITTDVGQNQVWVAQSIKTNSTQRVLFSGSFGAMGYSLPSAIGAYYGSGKKAVFCINGDGGLQMNLQELQFIARENIPVKIIVLNNNALGMIRHFQEMYFQSRYFQTKPEGGYSSPDFVKLSEAYGIKSKRLYLNSIDDFEWSDGPELIELYLEENTYVTPKLEFGKPNQDQTPLIDRELYNKIMLLKPYKTDSYILPGGVKPYKYNHAMIPSNNLRRVA